MTSTNAPSPTAAPTPPPRKRRLRVVLIALAVVVALLLLLVLLIPSLLSTGAGRSYIVSTVNSGIAGQVQIADLSLGWFSGQKVSGLKVLDPAGKTIVDAPEVDLPGLSLLGLIRGSRDFGTITLRRPRVDLVQTDKGELNLAQALASRTPKASAPSQPGSSTPGAKREPDAAPGLNVNLKIEDGTVTYRSDIPPTVETVTFSGVNAGLDVAGPGKVSIALKSAIAQGSATGSADAKVAIVDLYDAAGKSTPAQGKVQADVKLTGVPVAVVSRLSGKGDSLTALLGPVADLSVKADGPMLSPNLNIVASSANLKASLNAAVDAQKIELLGSSLTLAVTEPAWDQWTRSAEGSKASGRLLKPFDIRLDARQVSIPRLDSGGVNLAGAGVDVAATVGDIEIEPAGAGGAAGRLTLRGASATLAAEQLGKSFTATLKAGASQGEQTGSADLRAEVKNALTSDAKFDTTHASAAVEGAIRTLPLALVDQLAGNDGLLAVVLGPSLDATISANLKPQADGAGLSGTFAVKATSAQLTTLVNGTLAPDSFVATGSNANLRLTPAGAARLMSKGSTAKLVENANVAATVTKLTLPLKAGKGDFAAMSIDTQAVVDRLVVASPDLPGNAVLTNATLTLSAPRLDQGADVKLNAATDLAGQPGKVQAAAKVTKLVDAAGALDAAAAVVVGDALVERFPSSLADAFVKRGNLVTLAAGPTIDNLRLHLEAQPAAPVGAKPAAGRDYKFEIALAAPLLNADAAGAYVNGSPALARPAHVTAKVQPALVALLTTPAAGPSSPDKPAPESKPAVVLAQPANVDLYVTSYESVPAGASGGPRMKLGLKGTIDQVVPVARPGEAQVALRNLQFTLPDSEISQKLEATLDADVVSGSESGAVTLRANIIRPMEEDRVIDAWLTSSALPVALVDTLAGQRGKLSALLGEKLGSVTVIIGAEPAKPMTFSAKVEAERVKVDLAGQYLAGQPVKLKPNSTVGLLLTNDALGVLLGGKEKAPPLTVVKPAMLQITIAQAEVGTIKGADGKTQVDPARTRVSAGFTASGLGLKQAEGGQEFDLKEVTATLQSADLSQLVTLQGNVALATSSGGQVSTGSLVSSTQVKGLKFKDGSADTSTATIVSKTTAKEMPSIIVDTLARQDGQLVDLFGQNVSLAADVNYAPGAPGTAGNVDLDVQSENTVANLKGTLDKEMVLRLREDLTASVKITPRLGARLLPSANPLLAGAVSGERPATLRVKKETFAAPLKSLSLQTLVADGTIELGKVKVEPTSPIVGGFFTALSALSPSAATNSRQIDAKFTPLTFKVADGVLTSNDLWIETGYFTLGTQARVRAAPEQAGQLFADVVVAIPAGTLANYIPGLQIDRNRVFELGASGLALKVKPDYGKFFTSQIAPLLVAKGLSGKNAQYGELITGAASGLGSLLGKKDDKKAGGGEGGGDPASAGWVNHAWTNRPKDVVATQPATPAGNAPGAAPAGSPSTPSAAPMAPAGAGGAAKPSSPAAETPATQPAKKPSVEQSILGGIGELLREREETKAKKKAAEQEKNAAASKPAGG